MCLKRSLVLRHITQIRQLRTIVERVQSRMILEILANTGQVYRCADSKTFKEATGANARELEDLGGMDSPCSQDNLLLGYGCASLVGLPRYILNPNSYPDFKDYSSHSSVGEEMIIRS